LDCDAATAKGRQLQLLNFCLLHLVTFCVINLATSTWQSGIICSGIWQFVTSSVIESGMMEVRQVADCT
jgi:hypothetical protein